MAASGGPLAALAPARRRLLVGVVGLLVVVVVGVVVLVVVNRDGATPAADQDDVGPVLLVPGFGGSTAALDVLAEALTDDGRDVTVVDAVGDGRGDLREQAEALGDAVEAAGPDGGTVDLVGYSAGGVVVRWYVDQLDGAERVRRVLTLSSPHHGTDLAALAGQVGGDACPEACRQLAPDSDVLRTLNAGDETPSGPTWVSLWTADDATVVPPSSGTLDGADIDLRVQDLCPDLEVSHADMPRDPVVDLLVVDLLAAGPVETPAACPAPG